MANSFNVRFNELVRGASAYEVAVRNGFEGTEAEWIASLEQGAKDAEASAKKYAENAMQHKEEAGKYANNASQFANDAANQANNAGSHALSAKGFADKAHESAVDAGASANDALNYKNAAEQEKNGAVNASNDAKAYAENAKTSATNASTSENAAKNYAGNAQKSSQNASASEQEAAKKAEEARKSAELALSGVNSDWTQNDPTQADYIKGRTHYEEVSEVEVLGECKPSYNESFGAFPITEPINLKEGTTYIVNWNGVNYECVCKQYTDETTPAPFIVLGNLSVAPDGGEDTGEPFAICEYPEEMALQIGAYAMIMALDGSTEITISILSVSAVVHKLDNKFIDAEWMAKTEVGEVDVLAETFLDNSRGNATIKQPLNLVEGNTYYVYFEGTRYECVAKAATVESIHVMGLGNAGLNGGEDTGEPFAICELPVGIAEQLGYGVIAVSSISIPMFKIAVKEEGMVTPKLPDKFLDLEWSEPVKTVFYPETTVTTTEGNELEVERGRNLLFNFEMGDTVIVNWDGTQYECVVYPYTNNNGTSLCIGNATLDPAFSYGGWQDNDKPFCICFTEHPSVALRADTGKHTFSIEGYISTPKKIPEKYLPEMSEFILKSSTEGSTKKFKVTVDDSGTLTATEV